MNDTLDDDEKLTDEAHAKAARREERRLNGLHQLLESREGRAWLWACLEWTQIYRISFAGEATHATAFAEGARNVGLRILAEIHAIAPERYLTMMAEAKEDL